MSLKKSSRGFLAMELRALLFVPEKAGWKQAVERASSNMSPDQLTESLVIPFGQLG
jgi:hypothetical protein